MSITITVGKAGRLVVPKVIRESLGIREGSRLRLHVAGGTLEAVPEADAVRMVLKNGFPVIHGGPPLQEGDIVKAIQADRAERDGRILPHGARP